MTRSDRKIALAALLAGTLALVAVYFAGRDDTTASLLLSPKAEGHADTLSHYGRYTRRPYAVAPERETALFPFDPNTADSTQLLRLGLRPWQVRNIYKFRSRGGIYHRKEDFARLYGLTVKDYRRLEPYIRISADYQPAATLVGSNPTADRDTLARPFKLQEGEHVVLNTADTLQLMRVPGIGAYYASEIVRHGQWLGGYVSVDQLDEIDQFPQEAKKYFVVENASPRKLNLNRLTLQQLRRHPYINYYQAKAITDYRRLQGPLTSLDDLRFSRDFPPEAIERLRPYVEF